MHVISLLVALAGTLAAVGATPFAKRGSQITTRSSSFIGVTVVEKRDTFNPSGNTCVCRGVVGACVETCPVGARNRKSDCNCPCPDALAATCDAAGVSLTCINPGSYVVDSTGRCMPTFARYAAFNIPTNDIEHTTQASESICSKYCLSASATYTRVFDSFVFTPNNGDCWCKNNIINATPYGTPVSVSLYLGNCAAPSAKFGGPELVAACQTVSFASGSCLLLAAPHNACAQF